ncbi:MAG: Calx-beta domain-containing protein, partial [Kiritimatiellae bacterium]|nr:Calx-beta domain-containing protein [Kiritimatiellia bacterium]
NQPGGGSASGQIMLDEGRLEKVPRASNWVWACYMTMASNSAFQTYGMAGGVGATTGIVQFAASAYSVPEDGGTVTIRVFRYNGPSGPVTVDYATGGGTAVAGVNYTTANGTLSYANGETSKTFAVSVMDDGVWTPANLTVNIGLSHVVGNAIYGSITNTVLTILDADGPGSFQFSGTAYMTAQDAGTALITVTRANGKTGAASVSYATGDGTGQAGVNYTTTSGTLNFGNNETSKTFTVAILNSPVGDSGKTVNLTLSNPTAGATVGVPGTAVLTIVPPGPFSVWSHKMSIRFPGYTNTTGQALTNFPVELVFSNNMGGGFSYSQLVSPVGGDLRFADGANNIALNFEIEKWATNGPSCVWVQVPVLSNNCSIWAFWGNSVTTPPACTTNGATWNSDFRGVWHLGESGSGSHADSTANRNTATGGSSSLTAGIVDGAAGYSGAAYDTAANANGSLSVTDGLTFGGWVQYYDAANGAKNPFFIKGDNEMANDFGFIYAVNNGTIWFCMNNGSTAINFSPTLNTWYYIMGTYDKTTVRAYVNGKQVVSWANSSTINNGFASGTHLGGGSWGKLNGRLDECRIMSAAVSSNWIWTSYLNMASNSTFCSFGGGGGGVAPKGTPISWLDNHGLTGDPTTLELDDPDKDGMPTWQEYLAGTDPTSAQSALVASIQRIPGGSGLLVLIPSLSASGSDYTGKLRYYSLESRTNLILGNWQTIANYVDLLGDDAPIIYTNNNLGVPFTFYRIKAKLQ